jgi:hypothetical protein
VVGSSRLVNNAPTVSAADPGTLISGYTGPLNSTISRPWNAWPSMVIGAKILCESQGDVASKEKGNVPGYNAVTIPNSQSQREMQRLHPAFGGVKNLALWMCGA